MKIGNGINNHNNMARRINKPGLIIVAVIVTAVIIVLFVIVKDPDLKNLVIALLCSLLAGLLVSIFSDIPGIIESTSRESAAAFTSTTFMSNYSDERLDELKKDCIVFRHKLNSKTSNSIKDYSDNILKVESMVCDYLDKPFYEYYTEHHSYIDIDGSIVRNTVVEFLLNSNSSSKTNQIDIGISKYYPNDFSSSKDLFKVNRFDISIDGSERRNISKYIKAKISKISDDDINHQAYSSVARFAFDGLLSSKSLMDMNKTDHIEDGKGIKVLFNDRVWVHVEFISPFDTQDLYFVKKLRYPTKSFSLISGIPDGYRIYGLLSSPVLNRADSVVFSTKNIIHIESKSCFLPGSSAIVGFIKDHSS